MTIYATKYAAQKVARPLGWVTVKVEGGYTIMDPATYRAWKKQK